jgi:hypothetical protein
MITTIIATFFIAIIIVGALAYVLVRHYFGMAELKGRLGEERLKQAAEAKLSQNTFLSHATASLWWRPST